MPIKVKQWEQDLQGGFPCYLCGDSNPCGDIFSCAWWTSSESSKQLQHERFQKVKNKLIDENLKLRQEKLN